MVMVVLYTNCYNHRPFSDQCYSFHTNITCNGGNTGTASVIVTGGNAPYTYAWSPSGGTTATATNLTAGTYTCLITDAAVVLIHNLLRLHSLQD